MDRILESSSESLADRYADESYFNVKASCKSCQNNEICKYCEEFTSYLDKLKVSDMPRFINHQISCKYFKEYSHVRNVKSPETPIRGVDEVIENKRSFDPTRISGRRANHD